eukprot:SAG31_NODE_1503_length_8079_cov_5.930827_3_plen_579_part_00
MVPWMTVMVLSSMSCVSSQGIDTFPNIGYLGDGYDIYFGSPNSIAATLDGPDPGFRNSVFDITSYSEHRRTADAQFSVPDGVEVSSCNRCSVEFDTEVIRGTHSYTSSVEGKVELDAHVGVPSLFGAAFKASLDYKTVETSTSHEHNVFLKSGAECCVYIASIQAYNLPQISTNFRNAVSAMNYPYDPDDTVSRESFYEFIREFGTHVVTRMSMGARFGLVSEMSENDYSSLLTRHVDFSETASATIKAIDLSAGSTHQVTTDSREETVFSSATTSQRRYQVGAAMPRLDEDNTVNLDAWSNAVKEDPMPLQITVTDIATLLTAEHFEGVDEIGLKQLALQDALVDYCNTLTLHEMLHDCDPPGPDPPMPPLPPFGGVYQTNVNLPNPFTNGQSCPRDYTALFGGLVWNELQRSTDELYYCWRTDLVHSTRSANCPQCAEEVDDDPLQMFGGMWRENTHSGQEEQGNYLNNFVKDCAAPFSKVLIAWVKTGAEDHWGCRLQACLNLNIPLSHNLFGGFYQTEDINGYGVDNTYTHSKSCPDGFVAHTFARTVYGDTWTGTNVNICLDELWVPAVSSGH